MRYALTAQHGTSPYRLCIVGDLSIELNLRVPIERFFLVRVPENGARLVIVLLARCGRVHWIGRSRMTINFEPHASQP